MNICFIGRIIPKTIKFDQDAPPLKQQQLFVHNLNVCKCKLDHLRSKAKLKKLSETAMTVVALNWRRDHQERMSSDLARSSEKCNCKIFDPSPKSAPLLQFCKLRGHSEQESVPRTWPWVKVNLTKYRHVLVLSVCCSKYPKDQEAILSK